MTGSRRARLETAFPGESPRARLARAATCAGALAGLAAPAAACPYCAFSQSVDTLIFIAAFLLVPYAVVSGTWIWMRRVLRAEAKEES